MNEDDCQHLSWECSGAYGDVGPAGSLHQCTECDKKWMSLSEFARDDQVGVCGICGQPEKDAPKFVTKDSGKREEFTSGAVRDTQDNKPRYDLIPPKGLRRVADLYARGANKYEDHNWRKGMPSSRFMASLLRHIESYRAGERDEDHIAAVIFNALALIEFEGTEWDDLTELW